MDKVMYPTGEVTERSSQRKCAFHNIPMDSTTTTTRTYDAQAGVLQTQVEVSVSCGLCAVGMVEGQKERAVRKFNPFITIGSGSLALAESEILIEAITLRNLRLAGDMLR